MTTPPWQDYQSDSTPPWQDYRPARPAPPPRRSATSSGVGAGGGVEAGNAIQQDDAAGHRLTGAALTGLQDNVLGLARSIVNPGQAAVDSVINGGTWAASHMGVSPNALDRLRAAQHRSSTATVPDLPAAGRGHLMNVQPQNMAERGAYVAGGALPGLLAGPTAALPTAAGALGQFGAQEVTRAFGGSEQDQQMAGQAGGVLVGFLGAGAPGLRLSSAEVPARPLSPQRALSNAGVELTPGQMLGPAASRAEQSMTSVPLIGDAIKSAQRRGIQSFNRVAINQALAPIRQALPRGLSGREAVAHADQTVSNAYDEVLNPIESVPATPELAGGLANAVRAVSHRGQRAHAQGIAADITARFQEGLDGQGWKQLDSDLNTEIRHAQASDAPGSPQLVRSLRQMQNAIRGPIRDVNPVASRALRSVDSAFARMHRVGTASEKAGTAGREGLFSPAQLDASVRTSSRGSRQYRRGQALGQDLTEPAMQVLPQTVPDSGTPYRHLMQAAGAAAAGETAHLLGPEATGAAVVGGGLTAAGMAVYSHPVQALLNTIYRATGGTRNAALARLGREAARDPALVPEYQRALAYTRQPRLSFVAPPLLNALTGRVPAPSR